MLDIEDFDVVFRGNSYTQELCLEINQRKWATNNKCFFERLLELLQIKWRKIYPPTSEDQLRELHSRITNAPIALHYKHCLLFYLLKDLSPTFHNQDELATTFAGKVHLEKKFWTFIEGLWLLDHAQYETAVGNLTHPSIIPTFPDEIILILLARRNIQTSKMPDNDVLPLAYYNCTNPPLASVEAKTEFVKYLASRSITETLYWIRGRPEHEHKSLMEILIEETLRSSSDYGTNVPLEARALEFVGLPFSDDEERWIETFLTQGKGRNIPGAADTVIMRRFATGRAVDIANDTTTKGKRFHGINWDVLKEGVRNGLGPRQSEDHFAA